MISSVTSALATVISCVTGGETSGELNVLLPLLAFCVALSALMVSVRAFRSFAWGD